MCLFVRRLLRDNGLHVSLRASEKGTDTLKCISLLMDENNEGSTSRKTGILKAHVGWIICQRLPMSYCKEQICILYVLRKTVVIDNHLLEIKIYYVWMEGVLTLRPECRPS